MKRKRKADKFAFRPIHQPYMENESDTLGMQYQRYLADLDRKLEMNGHIYYKIIEAFAFQVGNIKMLVVLDNEMMLRMGDTLIDENEKTYEVKGFEMIRFVDATFPDWYLKVSHVALDGDVENIGNYVARL